MAKYSDPMDRLIAAAVKELAEEAKQGMPDVEVAWADFQKRMRIKESKQKNKNKYKKYLMRVALVASVALVLMLSTQNEKVTAFKNEAVQWFRKDVNQGTVITEHENPQIEEGTYTGLNLSEAQEIVIFQLANPKFLPKGFNKTPEIEVQVYEYPWVLVKMVYKGEKQKVLIIKQENSPGNEQRNTFAPNNAEVEKVNLDNKNIILMSEGKALNAKWSENGIRYTVTTYELTREENLEVIKNLN